MNRQERIVGSSRHRPGHQRALSSSLAGVSDSSAALYWHGIAELAMPMLL